MSKAHDDDRDEDEDEKDIKDDADTEDEDEDEPEEADEDDKEEEEESSEEVEGEEQKEESEEDATEVKKRKYPRLTSKERRERIRAAKEQAQREREEFQETVRSLKQQNEQLQEFVTKVATRVDARDVNEIESRLHGAAQRFKDAENYIAQANKVIETAFETGNSELFGRTFAEIDKAKEIKAQAANEYNSLKVVVEKLQATRPDQEERVQRGPDWNTEREAAKKRDWLDKNTWYGKDEVASAFAKEVNNKLLAEGYKPDSDAFWSELSKRVRDKLPDRFRNSQVKKPPQMVGGRETTVSKSTGDRDDMLPVAFRKVLNERYGRDKSNPERKKAVSYYLQSLKENR